MTVHYVTVPHNIQFTTRFICGYYTFQVTLLITVIRTDNSLVNNISTFVNNISITVDFTTYNLTYSYILIDKVLTLQAFQKDGKVGACLFQFNMSVIDNRAIQICACTIT